MLSPPCAVSAFFYLIEDFLFCHARRGLRPVFAATTVFLAGLITSRPRARLSKRAFDKQRIPAKHILATNRNPRHRDGRVKIICNAFALLFRRRV